MPVVSPSKYMTLEYAKAAQEHFSASPTGNGKEYDAEALQELIDIKGEKHAQLELTGWLKSMMNPEKPADDGMIELLMTEQQIKDEQKMAIEIVADHEERTSTAQQLREGLSKPASSSEVKRLQAEVDNVCSEMNRFRSEIFTAKSDFEDMRVQMSEVVASKSSAKIMKVSVDGAVNKLSRPASPYLARMLIHAKAGLNTILVGPSQCGKTTMGLQLGEALGRKVYQNTFKECISDGAIWGRRCHVTGEFTPGPAHMAVKHGHVYFAEEIDGADANSATSLNRLFDDSADVYCPMSNETIPKHPNFVSIASANTAGRGADFQYTSRNRLDAATLQRFVPILCDYDIELERSLCDDDSLLTAMHYAREKLRSMKSKELISTKTIKNAHALKVNGISMADIVASITLGWPAETVSQCFPGSVE